MKYVEKVSQKQMCYTAELVNAKRLGCDCSHYESILSSKERMIKALSLYRYDGKIDVMQDKYGVYKIEHIQKLYSEGVYGNSGQLHLIIWTDLEGFTQCAYVFYTNLKYKF